MKRNVFLKCCLKYWPYFLLELILAYFMSVVIIKGNTIIGNAVDSMLAGKEVQYVDSVVLLVIYTLFSSALAFFKSVFVSQYSVKVQTIYKNIVAKKLFRLQYRYFDKNGSASIINRLNADIAEVDTLLSQNVPTICSNFVTMIVYAIYVGQINVGLVLLMLICYPVIFNSTNIIVKKIVNLKNDFRQKTDLITEIFQDCVNGIIVLRSFGAEEYFQKKVNIATDDLVEYEARRTRITNSALIVRKLLQWLPNIICAVYAYVMVLYDNISMGQLIIFLMILQRFVDNFVELPFNFVDLKEHMVCIARVEEILSVSDEKSGTESEGIDTDIVIAFENVKFSYSENRKVLNGLSFEIKKGQNVAFVGDSGGGKSTIFHLICGFYEINDGIYKLFGRTFVEWDIDAARNCIALVSQNVFLFPTTIMENVRYGKFNASDEQVIDACRNAKIHDFVMTLSEKYNTIVGERGILLSGGERQRISIARAFLKEAPILLLDEPTSAVDVSTERLIQNAIEKLSRNKTCITIAHRLSTIQRADVIMVLKDGRVVESGKHSELIKGNGVYAGMYSKEVMEDEFMEIKS